MKIQRRILGGLCGMLLGAAMGLAQSTVGAGNKPVKHIGPDFGTMGITSYSVSALEFSTFRQADTWSFIVFTPDRYLTDIGGEFEVPLHLPQGASIVGMSMEGCDNSSSGTITASLNTATQPAGGGVNIGSVATGLAETPGCVDIGTLVTPVTVDNLNNIYWFSLQNSTTDGSTYFAAARVFYQLQISPAPDSPSFTDVDPSNPFFKAIEALYASGITTGCQTAPLKFCPDDVVTRKEMASFLARALGLYWPN